MKHPAFRTFKTEKRRDEFPPDGCEFIYVITRADLPLKYVGRTKEPLSDRLRAHLKGGALVGENPALFSISKLEECSTSQAGERERHWISTLDTCNPSKGWNKYAMHGLRWWGQGRSRIRRDNTEAVTLTAVRLTADDRRLVDAIRAKLGVRNGAEVFRLGLRALAREQNVNLTEPNQAA